MKWKKMDPWYAQSECGKYRISKAGGAPGDTYTAWYRGGRSWDYLYVGMDKHAAMEACVRHAGATRPSQTQEVGKMRAILGQ